MLALYLWHDGVYADFGDALRYASVQHGFAGHVARLRDRRLRAMAASSRQLWMLFLGSFVACSGSTGGGIKMMRAMILYKQVFRELMRAMHPRTPCIPCSLGVRRSRTSSLYAMLGFTFIYMVTIVSMTLLLIGDATRRGHRLLGGGGLYQQHRSRLGNGGSGVELCAC